MYGNAAKRNDATNLTWPALIAVEMVEARVPPFWPAFRPRASYRFARSAAPVADTSAMEFRCRLNSAHVLPWKLRQKLGDGN